MADNTEKIVVGYAYIKYQLPNTTEVFHLPAELRGKLVWVSLAQKYWCSIYEDKPDYMSRWHGAIPTDCLTLIKPKQPYEQLLLFEL